MAAITNGIACMKVETFLLDILCVLGLHETCDQASALMKLPVIYVSPVIQSPSGKTGRRINHRTDDDAEEHSRAARDPPR